MLKTIILAGGSGTRMKSKLPKVLQKLNDKYLVSYVIDVAKKINSDEIIVVVGHQGELVENTLKKIYNNIKFVYQREQLGTGHAVMMAENFFDESDFLILCGDTPLVSEKTLSSFITTHKKENNSVSGISVIAKDSSGYGRIVRKNSEFQKIVEQKDATIEELNINEVNTGIYCFCGTDLKKSLLKIKSNNAQNELYLTDTLEILKLENKKVGMIPFSDENEFLGINNKFQLMEAGKTLQLQINKKLMENGVIFIDSNSCYIHESVQIGSDTIVLPNTIIEGFTEIGEDCLIGPNTTLKNMKIGDNVQIKDSFCMDSKVGDFTTVGPFAYIRPNSKIGNHVKIGDFVEIKNSTIGNNSKTSHLSYIGDSELGENINIGCGTITVNYDGKNKFKTIIEDNVFVGCNSNLMAPVRLKKNSFIAAGSTITSDVPENSLAIGRCKQENKKNWKRK